MWYKISYIGGVIWEWKIVPDQGAQRIIGWIPSEILFLLRSTILQV